MEPRRERALVWRSVWTLRLICGVMGVLRDIESGEERVGCVYEGVRGEVEGKLRVFEGGIYVCDCEEGRSVL